VMQAAQAIFTNSPCPRSSIRARYFDSIPGGSRCSFNTRRALADTVKGGDILGVAAVWTARF
jgi:hypothetical protein